MPPTLEGSLYPIDRLKPASSWAAPIQQGTDPPRSACFYGCVELTASAEQAGRKTTTRQTKESKEDASSSHVRTMRPSLSNDLQQINDSRKTAIIDSELDRLNIDIATLQETRLAENGSIKRNDTHSSGMERVLK